MDASISANVNKLIEYLKPPQWYQNLNLWNLLILFITACIIVWYTYETKKLRIEAQKTNKYSFRPIVILDKIYGEYNGLREIKIKNIGKGPALNIESRISQINSKREYLNLRELILNEKFNNLNENGEKTLSRIRTIDQYLKANQTEFQYGIDSKFVIIFTYEDIVDFNYQTIILIENINGNPIIKKTITDEYNSGVLKKIL